MTAASADMETVQRVLQQTGVDQTPNAPGLAAYTQAVAEGLMEWFGSKAPGLRGLFSWLADIAPGAIAVGGGLILVALLVVVVSAIRARRRRPPIAPKTPVSARRFPFEPERGKDAWRSELERRIAAGDVPGGLEALWWWFACSVATVRVDPSWTSHELLARCRRADLAPLARGLDRLLYGGERPGVEDLQRLFRQLDEALP